MLKNVIQQNYYDYLSVDILQEKLYDPFKYVVFGIIMVKIVDFRCDTLVSMELMTLAVPILYEIISHLFPVF